MLISDTFQDQYEVAYVRDVVVPSVSAFKRADNQLTYYQCMYKWEDICDNHLFVSGIVSYAKELCGDMTDVVIWFMSSDPYKGGKPFDIKWIGLNGRGAIHVVVKGQKSVRIEQKWTKKLGKFFNRVVSIIWEVN